MNFFLTARHAGAPKQYAYTVDAATLVSAMMRFANFAAESEVGAASIVTITPTNEPAKNTFGDVARDHIVL